MTVASTQLSTRITVLATSNTSRTLPSTNAAMVTERRLLDGSLEQRPGQDVVQLSGRTV